MNSTAPRAEHDVFLSYSWRDSSEVDRLEAALVNCGLRVFRDKRMPAFEAITEELAHAVDRSAVFLAYYSAHYPTRYACQWELTRAFLAARRLGDPRARVLVVNPEVDETHLAPIELTDAVFSMWRATGSAAVVADRVAAKVAAARARPLGPPSGPDLSGLNVRLTRPRRFVGRYRDMWDIHSKLHGGRLRAVIQPCSHSAVLVKAPAGMGKTSLAEQYGFLFAEAYPSGVMWTELGGAGRTVSGDEALSEYAVQLREQAKLWFGLDLTGLDFDRTRTVLAARLDERAADVLCVIDDLPAGLTRADLDRLIIPSERVHTVLTARTVTPDWPVAAVELEGLTTLEVEALFQAHWPELDRADQAVLAKLTARSGGHPLVLTAAARALRAAQGTGAADRFADDLDIVAESVIDELTGVIRSRGSAARLVLGFAATLAQAPFGADLVVAALARHLGRDVDQIVATALAELDEFSLIHGVRRGRSRQMWQVHALVADAARDDLGAVLTDELAKDAARVLSDQLSANGAPSERHRHAREIAANPSVPLAERRALLRAVTEAHEHHGDIPAAREAAAEAVLVAGSDWQTDDVLAAARLAIAAGDPADALDHTGQAMGRAEATADWHTEYRARFLAAAAHDMRGRYVEADAVFYAHPGVLAEREELAWMSPEESLRLRIERIASRRLRGHYRAAYEQMVALHPRVRREYPAGTHCGPWPSATVELARLQLRVNRVRDARRSATEVRRVFEETGLPHHPLCRAAVGIYAESELVGSPTEVMTPPATWRQAAARIGTLRTEAESYYGPDNPHALDLSVTYARALTASEDVSGALRVVTDVQPRIASVLGADHPLMFRAQFVAARARLVLGEYQRAREVLEDLLPRQVAALGRSHPEALVTRGDLAVALATLGESRTARRHLVEAIRGLREQLPWWHEDSFKVLVGLPLTVLPTWFWRLGTYLGRRIARPPE